MNSTSGDSSTDADQKAQSAKRLRALLDDVELTPEQTSDDTVPKANRDRELIDDVPPHHGNS